MIEAKNFTLRKDLEDHVQSTDINTLAFDDRVISGTIEELKKLHLSQGQSVYGMRVVATDYQVSNITPFKQRGEFTSRIDGRAIKLNKNE